MGNLATPLEAGIDAFLEWEGAQDDRYELVDGTVQMMAGGSANHDLVASNVIRAVGNALRGKSCRVHGSNLKVRSTDDAIMYPDAFVRCGPHVGSAMVVDDPTIVIEVLSPSTEQHDLTRKRWAYQAIPNVRSILFIDPDVVRVEQSNREPDGSWRSVIAIDPQAKLSLTLPGDEQLVSLSLADIYEDVDLSRSAEPTTANAED